MKFLVAMFLMAASTTALAEDYLPILVSPIVAVDKVAPMLAVQPGAHIEFQYASCAATHFEIKKSSHTTMEGVLTMISVVDSSGMDCMGPVTLRPYSVQISSDVTNEGTYVLKNPTVLATKSAR